MAGDSNRKIEARKHALAKLLSPIKWAADTSVRYRQSVVTQRHSDVKLVLPFLDSTERRQALKWIRDESHDGLWD